MKRIAPWLHWGAALLVVSLAGWLLWRQLQGISLAQLRTALVMMRPSALAACVAATALSFVGLAAYERMATQWLAPGKVPRTVAWRTGLLAHALSNALGFHALTAVAFRLRTYRAHGIDGTTLAKIVATIAACIGVGVLSVLLIAAAWSQYQHGRVALLVLLLVCIGAAVVVERVRLEQVQLRSPVLGHLGVLVAVGVLEMGAAMAALAVLLPAGAVPLGPAFVGLFVGAMLLGIVSHAPGGVGVFEATVLAASAPEQRAGVLAGLLAWRAIYSLLPFSLAALAVAWRWWRERGLSSRANRRA